MGEPGRTPCLRGRWNVSRERPILFSGPMVRAILEGRKTVTRRLVTVPWKGARRTLPYSPYWDDEDGRLIACDEYGDWHPAEEWLGTWQVGQRLWVKETFAEDVGDLSAVFRADREFDGVRWTPSIFMPRYLSRITLDVTSVRIERLHAITEDDAKAEGVQPFFERFPCFAQDQTLTTGERCIDAPYRASYAVLWDELNDERATWKSNPWVWRVEFRRIPKEQDGS